MCDRIASKGKRCYLCICCNQPVNYCLLVAFSVQSSSTCLFSNFILGDSVEAVLGGARPGACESACVLYIAYLGHSC